MHRSEAEFCRHQADRLLRLADGCVDPQIREQVTAMANEWLERAKAKTKDPTRKVA
jgi:hypothetical protein